MKVEIYGSAESHTVRGATVNFNADSAAPVTEFVAEVNPNGFDGRTGVDINKNGTTQSVAFGKTCYGGSANVTTGTLTEEYGGGAYDPQNVPAEVKSEVESKLTLETATPGDIVSFDCELGEYPLNSLSFPLAPIQDLHGYDAPWPGGGGKNQAFNVQYTNASSRYQAAIRTSYKIKAGKRYIFSFMTANTGKKVYRQSPESLGFSSFSDYGFTCDGNRKSFYGTATTDTEKKSVGIILKSENDSDPVGLCYDFMIEEVSDTTTTPSSYAPYENICPISGWDAVGIESRGVNLNPNLGNQFTTNDCEKFFLKAGTYTFSTSDGTALGSSNAVYFQLLDENDNIITSGNMSSSRLTLNGSGTFYFGGQYYNELTFQLLVDAYVKMGFNNQKPSESYAIQIQSGNVKTDYHAYAGNTYTIQLGQTVYGGTLDAVNGTMTVDRAMVDMGTLAWGYESSNTQFYSNGIAATSINWDNWRDTPPLLCSRYKPISNALLASSDFCVGYAYNSKQLRVNDSGFTDAASFKTAMSGVQLVYELATPITIQLDPVTISTISGQTNNVWSDTGEISELKYYDGDIADTDIQTENGVLVTGDKLFYALSSPRTSSFTPTAVNTVQGKNTMSANTGNIAVTYTSNWFDITPWIAWQGLTFSRNDVDAPNAGRDMSGYMHRGRVASKEKMNIQTVQLTRAQSSKLQTLLFPETIMVRVTPYPRTNGMQVLYMYSNNVKTTYVIHRESGEDLQSLSFPLIEN